MFVIPEVLFSFLLSSLAGFSNKTFLALYTLFIKPQFFTDHPLYLFFLLLVECLGVLILLVINIKYKNNKIISVLLSILLFWLIFVLFMGYVVSFSMSFP